MGRGRSAKLAVLAALAVLLGGLLWGRTGLAAPIGPFSSPHPELSPPRPRQLGGLVGILSSRGGLREVESPGVAADKPSAKIGLQAGHWRAHEAPWPINTHTGSSGRGKTEAEVNLPIAEAAAQVLREAGHAVDVLPAVIPKGYRADLVVAIHADGGPSSRRGFFVDSSARQATAGAEAKLSRSLVEAYKVVGIPYVFRGTSASRYYYGYYSVDARTPMVLIETGFLTNPVDQTILIDRPDVVGGAIARGILDYLSTAVHLMK